MVRPRTSPRQIEKIMCKNPFSRRDFLRKGKNLFFALDDRSEFSEFSENILISTLDILDIRDTCPTAREHPCDDHRDSRTEIPARDRRATERYRSEDHRLMRIQDRDMSFHFFYFYEPVQTPLEENLMNPRNSLCLRHQDSKRRLKIGRKSWENIGLYFYRFQIFA